VFATFTTTIVSNLPSSVQREAVFFIGPILTIIVMLLFFTRAALTETPYWSKGVAKTFYLFAIPISAVFLIVIGVRIALVFTGQ
jgi:hypothetical protein